LSGVIGDRARLIDSILGTRTSWGGGGGVGVYGADVCALCGRIGTFRGWIMAAYGCHFGPHNEFVCGRCRKRLIPKGESALSEQHRLVEAALTESNIRFCRLCQRQIERHPRRGSRRGRLPRICAGCRDELRDRGITGDEEIVAALRLGVRRRFLELLDDSQLEAMSGLVDDMREELDSQRQAQAQQKDRDDPQEGSIQLFGQIGVYPDPESPGDP
jgi:hypothetical protein